MGEIAALKARIEQKRQAIAQLVRDSSVPATEAIQQFRAAQSQLESEVKAAKLRIQQFVDAKEEYQRLEADLHQKQQASAAARTNLEKFAQSLGKSALAGFLAGKIARLPALNERIETEVTIQRLKKEHSSLAASSQAGLAEKAKLIAQQVVIAGKLKLEETKLRSQESSAGKRLLELNEEQLVRCDETVEILSRIADARADVTHSQEVVDAAMTILKTRTVQLCRTLGLEQIDGTRSLDSVLSRCRQTLIEQEHHGHRLKQAFCDSLIGAESLPTHTRLQQHVTELRQLHAKLSNAEREARTDSAKRMRLMIGVGAFAFIGLVICCGGLLVAGLVRERMERERPNQAASVTDAKESSRHDNTGSDIGKRSKNNQVSDSLEGYEDTHKKMFDAGKSEGKFIQQTVETIAATKGYTKAERDFEIAKLLAMPINRYESMCKNVEKVAELQPNSKGLRRLKGMADGYREGFNSECKVYKLR